MKKGTKAWMDFAHRDLESSRLLVDSEYVSNVVLFHAQQCVEKCLKALLEENGVLVPHIHSVVKLHSLVTEEAGISIIIDEDELDLVDAVYIDTRYPSGLGLLPFAFPESQIPSAFRFTQIRNPQSSIQNRNALCSQSLNS